MGFQGGPAARMGRQGPYQQVPPRAPQDYEGWQSSGSRGVGSYEAGGGNSKNPQPQEGKRMPPVMGRMQPQMSGDSGYRRAPEPPVMQQGPQTLATPPSFQGGPTYFGSVAGSPFQSVSGGGIGSGQYFTPPQQGEGNGNFVSNPYRRPSPMQPPQQLPPMTNR